MLIIIIHHYFIIIIVVGLFKDYVWYPRKLPLLAISRICMIQGFEIVSFILFILECTMSIFLGDECASVFIIFLRKIPKIYH